MNNIYREKHRKIESSFVVMILIFTSLTIMMTPISHAEYRAPIDPSIRIYGEENAVYPTHSYTNMAPYAENFVYLDETMPFDPGVIAKDSITFNPIFLDHEYSIDANGDACEKVFLRTFYEPEYEHNPDRVMTDADFDILSSVGPFDAIVTETTYHFVSLDCRQPAVGIFYRDAPDFVPGEHAKMVLPYESCNDTIPGMDTAGLLDIVPTEGPYVFPFGQVTEGFVNLVDGEIAIEKQFTGLQVGQTIEFLDHSIQLKAFEDNDPALDKVTFEIRYEGNPTAYDGLEDIKAQEHYMVESLFGEKYYFNRDNDMRRSYFFIDDLITPPRTPENAPAFRWYMRIDNAVQSDYITITVGRELIAGETFYVNGVRYDTPAIYTKSNNDGNWVFKYLTLQSPMPKGDGIIEDFSHVTSQYLTELDYMENVWLLPPYNMPDHVMIDDIGLTKDACVQIPTQGLLLEEPKDPLSFYYIAETIEPRFDTSLAERLNTYEDGEEVWEWYNIYTQPNQYTEFVLPDQEGTDECYDDDCKPSEYHYTDGVEYLITTSFIGPNTATDPQHDRSDICKAYDEHEIYHRAFEIEEHYGCPSDINYAYYPRVVYGYDAVTSEDLYINEYLTDKSSVRIYGEEDAIYPTHTRYVDDGCTPDYIYLDETMPFDPGVIEKDSITFNPLFLDGEVYGTFAKGDASEKIFLRAFYEPGYAHDIDCIMDDAMPTDLAPVGPFDAIVTETTYHFVSLFDRQPIVGIIDESKMWLPCESCDDTIPGMDHAELLTIAEPSTPIDCPPRQENIEVLTDGCIAVEKTFNGLQIGDTIEFMDHSIQLKMFEENDPLFDQITFEIRYEGNPPAYNGLEDLKAKEYSIDENCFDEKYYFSRDNDIRESFEFLGDITIEERSCEEAAAFRWYLKIDNAANSQYITLTLGRELCAGETFYVNGVRYDIPAVYTTIDNDGYDVFKFFTLQSPLPKGDGIIEDFSHVTSQYLTELDFFETIWVLPPYNMDNQVMIDDIGLEKINYGCVEIPTAGLMIEEPKDALDFCYIKETIEPRFDTSIAERLKTYAEEDEQWEWYNVFVRPNQYTEFYLPDQEDTDDTYVESGDYADGNEYLITSSWIAPNSNLDTDRSDVCKTYDEHEIFFGVIEQQFSYGCHDVDVENAIVNGLAYLASTQNPDGSWGLTSSEYPATTALVLLKFEDRALDLGVDPFDNNPDSPSYYEYADNVISGMNYLLSQATIIDPLPIQLYGDPDTNANGQGIAFGHGISHREIYSTGLALCALSLSQHPYDRSYDIGGTTYTYKEITQDTVDWMAYAQIDSGTGRGGWRYEANYASGDNSNAGYAVLGLDYAEDFGCVIPSFVKDELNIWIDYIQNDVSGGSGYEIPTNWVNILKTGNLIHQMSFYGDTPVVARVIDAIAYLEAHWRDQNQDPGWGYNGASNYQAIYTTMKGLSTMGVNHIDTDGDGFQDDDWFCQNPPASPAEDFVSVILSEQNLDGSWPMDMWGDNIQTTAWALLTLEKAAPSPVATMYPRFSFEYDAENSIGLFINKEISSGGTDMPPTSIPGGPYTGQSTACCDATIYFNGCSSHDNDEGDTSIVQYDWNFGDGTGWHNNIGCNPSWQYPEGYYTVSLKVTDDEGQTNTETTTVEVTAYGGGNPPPQCDVNVTVDDINIVGDGYSYGWVKVLVNPAYTGEVNIVKFTVSWDETVVTLIDTDTSSAWDLITTIDTNPGQITATAYKYGIGFSSDTNILKLTFSKATGASSGDECDLELDDVKVAVGTAYIYDFCEHDGHVTIDGTDPALEGDFNLDGIVDEIDVYLLGTHVMYGDPVVLPQADVDMNDDDVIDELDVYLLGTLVMYP